MRALKLSYEKGCGRHPLEGESGNDNFICIYGRVRVLPQVGTVASRSTPPCIFKKGVARKEGVGARGPELATMALAI